MSVSSESLELNIVESINLASSTVHLDASDSALLSSTGSVGLEGMSASMSASDSMTMSAGGDLTVASGGDVDVLATELTARADAASVVVGSAELHSPGAVEMISGSDVSVTALGNSVLQTAGTATVETMDAALSAAGGADMTIQQDTTVSIGGAVALTAGNSGSAFFKDEMSVSAGSVMIESGDAFVGVAETVAMTGTERVRVGSNGAAVELGGAGELEYVMYVWRSSSSFNYFTNVVPAMDDVTEVVVRGAAASVESTGGTTVSLALGATSLSFVTVWDSTLGAGSYSMDGLHATFGAQSVVAVRLSASSGGVFVGWDAVVLHFGISVKGSVAVAASGVLDAVAGDSMSVSSKSVSVSASGALDVLSESSTFTSESVRVHATAGLQADVGYATIESVGDMSLTGGGAVAMASSSLKVESTDSLDVSSAEVAAVSANVAVVELSERVDISTPKMKVRGGESVEVYSGETVDVHTSDFTVNAGGTVSAFAGDHAELSTGTAVLDASESVTVHTGDLRVVPSGIVELAATEAAKLVASSVDVASSGYTALTSVGSLTLSTATGDLEMSAGGKLTAEAEVIDIQGGYADVQLAGAMDVATASTTTVSALAGLGASTAGGATLAADRAAVELGSDAAALIGGDATVSVGGGVDFGATGALSASAAAIEMRAGELTLDSAGALTVDAADLQLQTVGDLSLATPSSSIRATVDGQLDFVSFLLPGGSGFDEFENLMPTITSAQSVTVRGLHNQVLAIASGTRARIQLLDVTSGVWFEAWSLVASGDGLVSHGFSRSFPISDIGGFRLSSTPPQNPTYGDWGDVVISFGVHGGDTLALSTLGVVEVTSGEGLRLESKSVAMNSGDTIEIGSGGLTALRAQTFDTTTADDTIMVAGRDMRLQALDDVKLVAGERLQVGAERAILDIEDTLSAQSGGALSLASTASTASLSSVGALSLTSATTVDMTAAQSLTFSAPSYDMQASDGFALATDSAVEISGAQLLVHTDDYAHVTSDVISVAANTSMEVLTGGMMTVDAASVDLSAAGAISALAADAVAVESGAGMSLHAGGAMSVVAGEAALLAATELAITTAFHQITMAGPDSALWGPNATGRGRRLDGGAMNSTNTSRMDVAAHGDATMTVAEQLTLSARLLAASIQGDADVMVDGTVTLTASDAVEISADALDIVSPDVALSAADVRLEVAETVSVTAAGSVDLVGAESVSVDSAVLSFNAVETAHLEAGSSGATLDMGQDRVAIASDATTLDERCAPAVCLLSPVVVAVAAVTEGCDASTGNEADCFFLPATADAPGSCAPDERISANAATCTYRPAVEEVVGVAGSCSYGCSYVAAVTAVEAVTEVVEVTEACLASTGLDADHCLLDVTAGTCTATTAGLAASATCTYVAPVEAVAPVAGVTGVAEGCVAATCTLTPADPHRYVEGSCAGEGCTYFAPRDTLKGAAVTVSHSEATHKNSASTVTVEADELSYDGTLTTAASDRADTVLSGLVMVSGTSLVGTKAKFKTELAVGDIVRPQGGSENRVVVAISTNSLARLDAAFTGYIAPRTPFLVDRPLVHMNREAGTPGHTADTGGGSSFTVTADGRIGIGTSSPGAALEVNGAIRSAMWGLQKVMPYAASQLPRTATVRSHGGMWKLSVSAQAMRLNAEAGSELVVEVLVDDVVVGRLWTIYSGAPGVNVAIPADTLVLSNIAPGVHTVTLRHGVSRESPYVQQGVSDADSVSTVTLEELPFTG